MKKICAIMIVLLFVVVSPVFATPNNEGLWVRNWVGWGETQHWTDISDMLDNSGSFTEIDPIFETWKNSTYQIEQNLQWNAINNNTSQIDYLSNENSYQWSAITTNTTWNMLQQGQINYLNYENSQQWHAIADESSARQYYDQLLQGEINEVDFKSKMRDLYLNNEINAEAYQRMISDQFIHNASVQRDMMLAGELHGESITRQYYDQLLQGEINEVDYKSKMRDAWLDNKIDKETYERMVADRTIHNASVWRDAQLAGMIDEVDENSIQRDRVLHNMISDNTRKIQNNSDRIKSLEDPKFNIVGSVRFYDTKEWTINGFAAYDITNERLDRYGIEFVFKTGPSYEEKLIQELMERIEKLEAK